MALRAAKSAGCAVASEHIDKAVAYLKRCAVKDGGVRATSPGRGPTTPAPAPASWPWRSAATTSPPRRSPAPTTWSSTRRSGRSPYFFYEAYYCSQAMFQVGDKYFQAYYPKLVAMLLEHQQKDGSWLSGDGNDQSGGRDYCTAMAVLALAVEYRYLPIYQR